jgi:glycosyltransferase involved in cell wall biosynthesis
MPLVSVVLSFRNEAGNIPPLIDRLARMFEAQPVEYELVFVNDASTDSSREILIGERARNARVKIINLSRRFGVAEGVRAGMAAASGDAVVYMDADLQDPPEIIPQLLEQWRAGAAVVHTVRTRRHGEHWLKMWLTGIAYRLIQSGSSINLPVDAGDFKLLSRQAVDHLLRLGESDPYLRGLVVWIGFTQVFVPYERDARHAGRTHFPFFSRNPWKTFALGLTSFSFMPIYACLALAATGVVASLVVMIAAPPLVGLMILLWAMLMGAVAIVGIYVIRIYKDVRSRPQFIVDSTVGFEGDGEKAPAAMRARGY